MTQGSESTHSSRRTVDTVLSRFERWARDTPGAQAVAAGPDGLTYGQLDARADQVASRLLDAGLPERAVVAVGTDRRAEAVVALLGVLKAGAACAVVDVEDPRAGRRQLAAVSPFALLAHATHQARLDEGGGLRVIRLGGEAGVVGVGGAGGAGGVAGVGGVAAEVTGAVGPAGRSVPPARAPRGDIAAVLFTGGADRRPVRIGHERLLAAHESWAEVAGPEPEDRHLITAGPGLTGFATGWTRALCTGGTLVLPDGPRWTAEALRRTVEAERVTFLHTDPGTVTQLLLRDQRAVVSHTLQSADEAVRSLRLVTVTGDRLYLDEHSALLARLRPGARLLNVYGTTESAGIGTWFELPQLSGLVEGPERLSLIGTPFPGCHVDLRDGELRLTPPGGGDPVPTGDLAELRPDGLLEFGGRIRDRLTVRGGTLDPHPVESEIRTHGGIGAVLLRQIPGEDTGGTGGKGARSGKGAKSGKGRNARPVLVAYIAPPAEANGRSTGFRLPDGGALRRYLADKVPADGLPRKVIWLAKIPRDRAGREDRDALPLPVRPAEREPLVRGSGKSSAVNPAGFPLSCSLIMGMFFLTMATMLFTDVFWPGSTDLTGVPNPYAFLFSVLYLFEATAFAAGVLFLFMGRSRMRRQGRGPFVTKAAHLAVFYLLAAWWPQDNSYRLAAKQDWPLQALLVYAFNVPLMIAAAIVVLYVTQPPRSPFDFDPDPGDED
ncbi:AMP-binding protein [Streptomyces sp. NPDC059443]|uniref:AMP-binding protein n=1 Tax=unclassified Streptomyces TaxID=2593676 RepID=UPI003676AFE7